MTGTTRSSADISPRAQAHSLSRLHRGIREMDLILGQFADDEIATLSDEELDELERIMAEEDADLVKYTSPAKSPCRRFTDAALRTHRLLPARLRPHPEAAILISVISLPEIRCEQAR